MDSLDNPKPKYFPISQRRLLCLLCFFAVFISYTLRMSLTIVLAEIVKHPAKRYNETCLTSKNKTQYYFSTYYYWNREFEDTVNSAFYWGYCITQIPSGYLSDHFGGKHILTGAMFGASCLACWNHFLIKLTRANYSFITASRMLEGLLHGTMYPSLISVLAKWTPHREITLLIPFAYSGASLGVSTCLFVSKLIFKCTHTWWPIFYVFGVLGFVWCLCWHLSCYSDATTHPCIANKEKEYLQEDLENTWVQYKQTPWVDLLTSGPVWGLVTAQVGHDWAWYILIGQLCTYLSEVLYVDPEYYAFWTWGPFMVMWATTILFALVASFGINAKYVNTTNARLILVMISALGAGVSLLFASFARCNRLEAGIWFVVAMALMGADCSATKANVLDLAPNFAGTISGLGNAVGALGGIISPLFVGVFVSRNVANTMVQWENIFWITFFIYSYTTLIYMVFGNGNRQNWNTIHY